VIQGRDWMTGLRGAPGDDILTYCIKLKKKSIPTLKYTDTLLELFKETLLNMDTLRFKGKKKPASVLFDPIWPFIIIFFSWLYYLDSSVGVQL
jgi:hypothetical protein